MPEDLGRAHKAAVVGHALEVADALPQHHTRAVASSAGHLHFAVVLAHGLCILHAHPRALLELGHAHKAHVGNLVAVGCLHEHALADPEVVRGLAARQVSTDTPT